MVPGLLVLKELESFNECPLRLLFWIKTKILLNPGTLYRSVSILYCWRTKDKWGIHHNIDVDAASMPFHELEGILLQGSKDFRRERLTSYLHSICFMEPGDARTTGLTPWLLMLRRTSHYLSVKDFDVPVTGNQNGIVRETEHYSDFDQMKGFLIVHQCWA